jgi:hypothetical protein
LRFQQKYIFPLFLPEKARTAWHGDSGFCVSDYHSTSADIQDRQGNRLTKHGFFYFPPNMTAVIPAQAGIQKN